MMNRQSFTAAFALALVLTMSCSNEVRDTEAESAGSTLLRNVVIVDGTGAPAFPGDLRIRRQHIEAIGELEPEPGELIVEGGGMVLAAEVLVSTGSVRETIKRPIGNPPLKELMESGQSMYGMQTFELHIKQLIREGLLDREVGRAAMGF